MDGAAIDGVSRRNAVVDDVVRADRTDGVHQLDVEVVEGHREILDEVRGYNDARRIRIGLLRRQIWVAAEKAVVLRGAIGPNVAVLRGTYPRQQALRLRCAGRLTRRARTGIDGSVELDRLRSPAGQTPRATQAQC